MKLLPIVIVVAFAASSPAAEDLKEARAHWAYQPISKPPVPAVKTTPWVKTPVDAFILARLEVNGMKPSPAASRETLLRRATFDLIGLPPTTDELRAFLADNSPDAFTKVVDRLLASPHFGERWGRHWLDTARYSDTAGQAKAIVESYRYDGAWSYRDYVIAAFNDDKPYDQFILEQIAADKLPRGNDPTVLAALGFLAVGERFQNKNDVINDRIDVVTKGFLGLTVVCARCHDHKFDPIPTEDYYALHGIFNSSIEPVERPLITMAKDKSLIADYQAKLHALEDKDRDLYFEAIEKINGDFRQKVAVMLLNGGSGGEVHGAVASPNQTHRLLQTEPPGSHDAAAERTRRQTQRCERWRTIGPGKRRLRLAASLAECNRQAPLRPATAEPPHVTDSRRRRAHRPRVAVAAVRCKRRHPPMPARAGPRK